MRRRASITSALAAAALALASSGCFTTWAIVQGSGNARILEEGAREEHVPQPGVHEFLRVTLPLAEPGPDANGDPRRLALACTSTQSGQDSVHRSAFRYGKNWKIYTAVGFVLEGLMATAFYFSARADANSGDPMREGAEVPKQVAAGVIAVDAVGTAALVFVPRKEVFRTEMRTATTTLRDDCPDGLLLEIAGESYKVDAAGRIGELGEAALDAYMKAPTGAVRLAFAAATTDVPIGSVEQCTWMRTRHPGEANTCGPGPYGGALGPSTSAVLELPMGTLTRVD